MKKNLSDTWIRRALSSGELKPGDEVYDQKNDGLVFRVRKTKQIWYLYRDRGRSKQRLCDWPDYNTVDARKLHNAKVKSKKPRRKGSVPTLQNYFDATYKPEFELIHKSGRSLYSLNVLRKHFENDPLNDITAEAVHAWRLARRRKGIAPSTLNRQVSALRALLKNAIPTHLDTDPFEGLKPLKVEQEFRVRYLSGDEETSLRQALDDRDRDLKSARVRGNKWRDERGYELMEDLSNYAFADHLKPMVLISINTGLRQGELFNLQWKNVVDGFVTVSSAVAKSRRSRSLPLNREAISAFEGWKVQAGDTGYVFRGSAGKFDNVRKAWNKLLRDAEIYDFRWHDMRHHFASKLVMKGVPLNTVRELLGHADLQTTMRYAHLAPKHLKEAVELLDD